MPSDIEGASSNESLKSHFETSTGISRQIDTEPSTLAQDDAHTPGEQAVARDSHETFQDGAADPYPTTSISAEQVHALQEASELMQDRLQKLQSARNELLTMRNQTKFEVERWRSNRDFVAESRRRFFDEAEKVLALGRESSWADELRASYALALQDHGRETVFAESVSDLTMRLAGHESEVQRLDMATSAAAHRVGRILEGMNMVSTVDAASSHRANRTPSTSSVRQRWHLHPLVEYYFDKIGDLKLAREKLFNLEQDHNQEKALRQFFRDQDVEPEFSDKDFDRHWLETFADAELAYEEAQEKTDLARKICELEGLSLNMRSKASSPLPQDYDSDSQSEVLSMGSTFQQALIEQGSRDQQVSNTSALLADATSRPTGHLEASGAAKSSSEPVSGMLHDAWVAEWVQSTQAGLLDLRPRSTSDLASSRPTNIEHKDEQTIDRDSLEVKRMTVPPWPRTTTPEQGMQTFHNHARSRSF